MGGVSNSSVSARLHRRSVQLFSPEWGIVNKTHHTSQVKLTYSYISTLNLWIIIFSINQMLELKTWGLTEARGMHGKMRNTHILVGKHKRGVQ
jgi:hypothetical protein